jgi:ATP phosphoribosyltransferase regulatory subunit HisZ
VTRSVVARLLLVVALLAGWQASLVHPLEHVDAEGVLVHAGHDEGSSTDRAENLCDALAALTACATQAATVFEVEKSEAKHSSFAAERLRRADPPPFLSQGPPTLL